MAKSNYFQDQEKRYGGENWIQMLRPEDIQYGAKRLFKEMIRGNIDYQTYGKYFLDPKFIDNLIINAENELSVNTLYYNALDFYSKYYPTPEANVQKQHLQSLCFIYGTIRSKLVDVRHSGNIGYLVDTSALLYSHKNHLI